MRSKTHINLLTSTWLIALLGVFLMSAQDSGCNRRNSDSIASAAKEAKSVQFLVKKLQNRNLQAVNHLNAQAKVYVEGNGQSISANANIIWIRDSILWMNVKKFGLEAVRVLVTKDSVITLNRLEKTWSARSMAALQNDYSLPEGFALLQQFLLASAWLDPAMELKSGVKDAHHQLSGTTDKIAADYLVEEGSFLLKRETFEQKSDQRNVSFFFDNYKKTGAAGQFPYLRRVQAFSPETDQIRIELELYNVEINVPKQYRFEIPSSYEKAE
ncbi:MAG: DUF4292 domain-containing protein [Saprospiraceae bacterium]|nr:DUF4292 domain-containing protein [Saprospiraceae bacterium]